MKAILRAVLPDEVEQIPTAFEMVGHIAHLNLRESQLPYKKLIGRYFAQMHKITHKKSWCTILVTETYACNLDSYVYVRLVFIDHLESLLCRSTVYKSVCVKYKMCNTLR